MKDTCICTSSASAAASRGVLRVRVWGWFRLGATDVIEACRCYPIADRHSPLLVPPSNSPDPDKPLAVMGLCPARSRPFCPSHTPRPDMHIQDKPGVLLSKEKKKWEGGDQRGRLPAYATPQRGAAIAEAVPKHNSQTRSGPGGLGGSLPDRRCTGLSP